MSDASKPDPKPCPTCGHCPTCGQTTKPAQPELVPMPYPAPHFPTILPYSPFGDPPWGTPIHWKPDITCAGSIFPPGMKVWIQNSSEPKISS